VQTHTGEVTREECEIGFAEIFDQINAYVVGTPIIVVNREALRRA
jgi:D-3-phosphoglycerate dehydrogenase